MLKFITSQIKLWTIWILAVIISLMLTGVVFLPKKVSSHFVLKVGDSQLSQDSYDHILRMYLSSAPSDKKIVLQEQLLNQLTDHLLLQEDAKKSGVTITREMLNTSIFSSSVFQNKGKYSAKKFANVALYYGGIYKLKLMIMNNLLASTILGSIVKSNFSLSNELKAYSTLENQERLVQYCIIHNKNYISKVHISLKNLRAYYKSHISFYYVPKKVVLSYVPISALQFTRFKRVTPREVRQYYDENKSFLRTREHRTGLILTFKKKLVKKLDIINKISKKEPLSTVQKDNIVGEPVCITANQGLEKSKASYTLFQLTRSLPFRELKRDQYVILTDIEKSKTMTLSQAESFIRTVLLHHASRDEFQHILESINTYSFDEVISKNNFKVKESKAFSQSNASNTIEGNKSLQKLIFEKNKRQGFIMQGSNSAFIYQVSKIIPPHTLDFDQVKSHVRYLYLLEQSALLAKREAQKIKTRLESSKPLINKSLSVIRISRASKNLPTSILNTIFSSSKNKYQVIQHNGTFWIFLVKKVIPGKFRYSQNVSSNYQAMEVNDYLQGLHYQIPIQINRSSIRSTNNA